MNLFLAVICCKRDQNNGCLEWFRSNIAKVDGTIPYTIFLGEGCPARHHDETVLPVSDSYQRLPWKIQAALQWTFEQHPNTEIVFKVDCDCQVWPERLQQIDFSGYDYVGNFDDGKTPILRPDTYAIGAGYGLSRNAAQRVIEANVEQTIETRTYPPYDKVYVEDEFVGKVLSNSRRLHTERIQSHWAGRAYSGPTDNLIVLGNAWSTDRGRR